MSQGDEDCTRGGELMRYSVARALVPLGELRARLG